MKETYEEIRRILDEHGAEYVVSEHAPVYTSEEAARVRGVALETGVKALLLRTRERTFVLALVRADRKADLREIARRAGTRKVTMARPQEVLELTGCEVGSVPPFGFEDVPVFMDRRILENELVNFNAGLHTVSVRMKSEDLVEIVRPVLL